MEPMATAGKRFDDIFYRIELVITILKRHSEK